MAVILAYVTVDTKLFETQRQSQLAVTSKETGQVQYYGMLEAQLLQGCMPSCRCKLATFALWPGVGPPRAARSSSSSSSFYTGQNKLSYHSGSKKQ